MDAVNILLDKCKKARELPTDMALADALHVGRAAVSGWRHGKAAPDPVACARIADLTGEPLPRVLGMVGEQRAKSAAEKKVWRRLANAAAIAVVALLPFSSPATAAIAEAEQAATVCIMRNGRRWASLLARGFFGVRQIWASVTVRGHETAPMLAA